MNRFDNLPTLRDQLSSDSCPGIEVTELADLASLATYQDADPYAPHPVEYFCMIFIEQGQGRHQIDGIDYPYQDGSIIFVNREQTHAFDPTDKPTGKMLRITPAFFTECSANIRKSYFVPVHMSLAYSPILKLDPALIQTCRTLLHEIAISQQEKGGDDVVTQLLFSALMLRLAQARRLGSSCANDEDRARFNEFLKQVEQHFTDHREAKTYANKVGLSYKSLNLLCRRCCGKTAKQIIDFRLNLEITRKLSMKGGSIQSIAFELGFDDTTNFVKYFKRFNNVTPSAYRSRYYEEGMFEEPETPAAESALRPDPHPT